MADRLGYEYLGKGFTPIDGKEGFIIRQYGTTNYKVIGGTQDEAYYWLVERINELEELKLENESGEEYDKN